MLDRNNLKQRSDLTYKANRNAGRHGWLRLTPAYSLKLVREQLESLPKGSIVLEPFSGSGTTPLVAQELGLKCEAREINPFLVWFGNAKLDSYDDETIAQFSDSIEQVVDCSSIDYPNDYWTPPLFKIEKWWNRPTLQALASLRFHIDGFSGRVRNLLDVAFCRVMIASSSAAFNHQSMSFKDVPEYESGKELDDFTTVINAFSNEAKFILSTLDQPMIKTSSVEEGDSTLPFDGYVPADFVITSPPYANRMSYIREMRPYMYWLRFLDAGSAAGDLDWKTTGGTWGSASTRLKTWSPDESTPLDSEVSRVCARILKGKSGEILSPYVRKYFYDMWHHFKEITSVVKPSGKLCYIVGNSTFSGYEVPTQQWYAEILHYLGYEDIHIDTIRKRNSNKKLFEYAVCATKPH